MKFDTTEIRAAQAAFDAAIRDEAAATDAYKEAKTRHNDAYLEWTVALEAVRARARAGEDMIDLTIANEAGEREREKARAYECARKAKHESFERRRQAEDRLDNANEALRVAAYHGEPNIVVGLDLRSKAAAPS